jgi:hypothetical protein
MSSFPPEEKAAAIACLEKAGLWEIAAKFRDQKSAGRPEKRIRGVTLRQNDLLELREKIIDAGGNLEPFLDHPFIPAGYSDEQTRDFLDGLVSFKDRSDLRRAYKIWSLHEGEKVSHPSAHRNGEQ